MITLIENKVFNKHRTVWTKDVKRFLTMLDNERKFINYETCNCNKPCLCSPEARWKVVEDLDRVKYTLDTNYSSNNRTEQYEVGLPSTTVICDILFPVNLKEEIYKLSWLNNVAVDVYKEKEQYNLQSMRFGTYIHKILELYLTDKRKYYNRNIDSLIQKARTDEEVLRAFPDFNDNRIEIETIARDVLDKFLKDELCKYECVSSEQFFNSGRLQGSVDFVGMHNNTLYINDFKTTRATYPTGTRKFGTPSQMSSYHRQLCSYWNELTNADLIPKTNNVAFKIFQFHLLSNEYKIFKVEKNMITKWNDEINIVLDWYWQMKG